MQYIAVRYNVMIALQVNSISIFLTPFCAYSNNLLFQYLCKVYTKFWIETRDGAR